VIEAVLLLLGGALYALGLMHGSILTNRLMRGLPPVSIKRDKPIVLLDEDDPQTPMPGYEGYRP
jgi:hypothetical protein